MRVSKAQPLPHPPDSKGHVKMVPGKETIPQESDAIHVFDSLAMPTVWNNEYKLSSMLGL